MAKTCYYDDKNGNFEFWIDWSGSSEGATSGFGPDGYYGLLTPAEIYSKKVTVNLSGKEFGKIVDPIDYFINGWNPEDRAGGYNNGSFINGVEGLSPRIKDNPSVAPRHLP